MSDVEQTKVAGFAWPLWIHNVSDQRTNRGHPYDQPLDVAVWEAYYDQNLTPAQAVDQDDQLEIQNGGTT